MQQQPLRSPCFVKMTVMCWTERLGAAPVWMNEHGVTRGHTERSSSLRSVQCSSPVASASSTSPPPHGFIAQHFTHQIILIQYLKSERRGCEKEIPFKHPILRPCTFLGHVTQ